METPEFMIIILSLVVLLVAYLSVYPKLAGNNVNKIALYDFFISAFILVLVGTKYWGTGYEFNIIVTQVNWFWFTFIIYGIVEIPLMIWYYIKHDVSL